MNKDLAYFEKLWQQPEPDLVMCQRLWDYRARDFNEHRSSDEGKKKITKVLDFLLARKLLHQGSEVLDIGCGPGSYTLSLAQVAKSVVGLDISPNMIAYAREKAAQAGVINTTFETSPWETLDLKAKGLEKKFDLVFASMCPGINSKETLLKMVAASRGFCFLSSFARREDSVKDPLAQIIFGLRPGSKWGNNIYSIFNILWLSGFYPSICYHDTKWTNLMEPEKAVDYYSLQLAGRGEINKDRLTLMRDYLADIARDGMVEEEVTAREAWLYWQV
ncbi:MAG: Mg-protoporphyrin IX methyl transferase [Firmicutes bacterium ADurb.Bin456]|nr:MAG: Mg-protoporphyrin IX methyl transferase [Firmicutes bacterium ADurb.Bin456]